MLEQKTVRLCRVAVKACPRDWDKLTPTTDEEVRHCPQCDRDVHFSASDADTIEKARAGLCVARLEPQAGSLPDRRVVVGKPEVQELPADTPEESALLTRLGRERGIAEALARLEYDTVDCGNCGYPVPTFRRTCYVCKAARR